MFEQRNIKLSNGYFDKVRFQKNREEKRDHLSGLMRFFYRAEEERWTNIVHLHR